MGKSEYLIKPKNGKKLDSLIRKLKTGFVDDGGATGGIICKTVARQDMKVNDIRISEGDNLVCIWSERSFLSQNLADVKGLSVGYFDVDDAKRQFRSTYQDLFSDINFKGTYTEDSQSKIQDVKSEKKTLREDYYEPSAGRSEKISDFTQAMLDDADAGFKPSYDEEPNIKSTSALATAERLKARLIVNEGFSKVLSKDMDYFDAKFTDTLIDTLGEENIELKKQLKNTGLDIENVHPDFQELLEYTNTCAGRAGRIPLEAYGWDEEDVKKAINSKVQDVHPELRCACLFSQAFLGQTSGILQNQADKAQTTTSTASVNSANGAPISE